MVVKAYGNTIQESWLNIPQNTSEIYGRNIFTLTGLDQASFLNLNSNATMYDPLKCITPIIIGNDTTANTTTNTDNTTNNSTNTNSNNSTTPNNDDFTFDNSTSSFQITHLIFIATLIVVISITLFCIRTIPLWQKLIYLLTLLLLAAIKLLYLLLSID